MATWKHQTPLLEASAHALTLPLFELAFTQARLQHNHLHARGHQTSHRPHRACNIQRGGLPQHQRCIKCIDTQSLVACIYFSNLGNKLREILKSLAVVAAVGGQDRDGGGG